MFTGSIVALVTPMFEDGRCDEEAFRELIDIHIVEGTEGIVICGTTGEAPTVSKKEALKLFQIALEEVAGRIPVIAGTGTFCTTSTIEFSREVMKLGIDGLLITTPYYNRPTQEGLYRHYKAIAENVALPIILYNVPSRTGVNLELATIERLVKVKNIVAYKDGSGNLHAAREALAALGAHITLLSGDDASALEFMLLGGKGVISVTANVAPKTMRLMVKAALAGEERLANELNERLMPLHKSLFVESNPIPVKWALKQMGWIKGGIRLPLTELSMQKQPIVRHALEESGII